MKVNVGPYVYSIESSLDITESGICDPAAERILIRADDPYTTKQITVMHEILHLIDKVHSLNLGEDTVDRIATGYVQALKSMGIIVPLP